MHRIGRTGRSGKSGIATTFINKANEESVLLDLKHLLMEAKQKVPLFLAAMQSENEKYLDLGGKPSKVLIKRFDIKLFFFQTIEGAVIVVAWVTGSQIVQNWRPSRANRRPTLAARITLLPMLRTTELILNISSGFYFIFL